MTKRQKMPLVLLSLSLALMTFTSLFALLTQAGTSLAATTQAKKRSASVALSMAQQVTPNPLRDGKTAVYTIHITNTGRFAMPATITNSLPSQVTPTGILTWTAVISPATVWTQQVVVTPTIGYQGPITNEVSVSAPTSWAENLSYCTTCAEEDNINIPLYGDDISHFRVTATHPQYDFEVDNCDADFSGCALTTSVPNEVTCTPLWDDGVDVISVCHDPYWWLPHTLTVTVGSESGIGHRLVWNRKIADEASWPEVLVLYQDGNLRLKPHPPYGRADVCFGSSVIIGPAPADPIRPYVEIESIVVDPAAMTLAVTYRNGESANLTLAVDREQAQVDVQANYDTSPSFATFRSMYVAEDNADVARVKTAVDDYALLDSSTPEWTTAWEALSGPRWFFYRQTVSIHNTSAPDILIEAPDGYATYTNSLTVPVVSNQFIIRLPVIRRSE
jgi:hypothetical protein